MKKLIATLVLAVVAVVSAQQKAQTAIDAASCFEVEGVKTIQVQRNSGTDHLILTTDISFKNFTDRVYGANKKQEIRIRDLAVKVSLVDTSDVKQGKPYVNEAGEIVNPSPEYKKVEIGKARFKNEFIIPKGGLVAKIPIAMDQITLNDDHSKINNSAFDKFMDFFNLLNGTQSAREKALIIFEGTCKVAIKGENNAWLWPKESSNFEWILKPNTKNEYILSTQKD
ncbi:MAG: hypothetical protein IJS08_18900 [Victivallales bacterium]|nr:hypothetical protein [Victivallales bacterium]